MRAMRRSLARPCACVDRQVGIVCSKLNRPRTKPRRALGPLEPVGTFLESLTKPGENLATEFADLGDLPRDVCDAIRTLGWMHPTPVQTQVIGPLLAGKDLIVQAQTGSGKTGAFGIPVVTRVDPALAATQALVLVPTRELASQVCNELAQLGKNRGVRALPIYGGVAYGPQTEGLSRGDQIVVGTPGRVQDHLESGKLKLDRTRIVILDEADEMLSQGFWPDIQKIQRYLPAKRQACLFSATMAERVRSLARAFLQDPETISLSGEDLSPQQIEHQFIQCRQNDKVTALTKLFLLDRPESAIIFCNTKADVHFVATRLKQLGFNASEISGDLSQAAREKALHKLRSGKLQFLVATDVAARGIDISGLPMVVSYATPDSPEVYVHRTGRTGRAGNKGVAVSLVSGLDIGNFRYMQNVNGIKVSERKLPKELPADLPPLKSVGVEEDFSQDDEEKDVASLASPQKSRRRPRRSKHGAHSATPASAPGESGAAKSAHSNRGRRTRRRRPSREKPASPVS